MARDVSPSDSALNALSIIDSQLKQKAIMENTSENTMGHFVLVDTPD